MLDICVPLVKVYYYKPNEVLGFMSVPTGTVPPAVGIGTAPGVGIGTASAGGIGTAPVGGIGTAPGVGIGTGPGPGGTGGPAPQVNSNVRPVANPDNPSTIVDPITLDVLVTKEQYSHSLRQNGFLYHPLQKKYLIADPNNQATRGYDPRAQTNQPFAGNLASALEDAFNRRNFGNQTSVNTYEEIDRIDNRWFASFVRSIPGKANASEARLFNSGGHRQMLRNLS